MYQPPIEKSYNVSWEQFHRDARALTWRLSEIDQWDAIVAITRGGLVPAAIVARELNIRCIETVGIASYLENKEQTDLHVIKPISEAFLGNVNRGASVLIVDDLVDTGKTTFAVRKMIPNAHFATVYAKPQGRAAVDTYMTEVSQDTWITFPWDMSLAYAPPLRFDKEQRSV